MGQSHLAPRMHEPVRLNQSDFIRGRALHDNFRTVQVTTKLLQAQQKPTIFLKVDM
jgi:hypothetical protein